MEEEMGNSQDQGVKGSSNKSTGSLKKQNSTSSNKSAPKSPKPMSQKSKNSRTSSKKSQNSKDPKSTPQHQVHVSQEPPSHGFLSGLGDGKPEPTPQEKLNTDQEAENRHDMQEKIQQQLEQIRVEEEARSELITKKQTLTVL